MDENKIILEDFKGKYRGVKDQYDLLYWDERIELAGEIFRLGLITIIIWIIVSCIDSIKKTWEDL